jgi:hypothetical protein
MEYRDGPYEAEYLLVGGCGDGNTQMPRASPTNSSRDKEAFTRAGRRSDVNPSRTGRAGQKVCDGAVRRSIGFGDNTGIVKRFRRRNYGRHWWLLLAVLFDRLDSV